MTDLLIPHEKRERRLVSLSLFLVSKESCLAVDRNVIFSEAKVRNVIRRLAATNMTAQVMPMQVVPLYTCHILSFLNI